MESKINNSRHKALVKKTVKECKKQSWLKYLNSLDLRQPAKKIWQKIKAIEGTNNITFSALKENNQIISDPYTITNILAKQFSDNSNDKNYNK